MTTDRIAAVQAAARKAAAAQAELEEQMRSAKTEGISLRAIAGAAGVSYETVRRIVASSR